MTSSIGMSLIGFLLKIAPLIITRDAIASPHSLTSNLHSVQRFDLHSNLQHHEDHSSLHLSPMQSQSHSALRHENATSEVATKPISLLPLLQPGKNPPSSHVNIPKHIVENSTEIFSFSLFSPNISAIATESYFFGLESNSSELLEEDDIDAALRGKPYEDQVQIYYSKIYEHVAPRAWTWMLIVCHALVFLVGLMGNALVCIAVYRNYTMRTVTNYFIVNLAVADFLVILFCLPPTVVWDVSSTWFFGDGMCKIVLYLQTVSVTVSVLTLTFISIDRWYAICYPLRFKSTTRRAQTAICVIWLISLLLDVPELLMNETRKFKHRLNIDTVWFTQCVPTWSEQIERNMQISRMLLLYFLPLMLMTIFYVQIIRVLHQSGTVTHNGIAGRDFNFSMVSNASTRGQLRSRKKAAKMLVSVVGMFAICHFPVHLLSLMRLMVKLRSNDVNNAFAMISHWLCYANSALNPIIYNFMSEKFRKEFHRLINFTSVKKNSHVELNAVWKTQLRKALSSSFGRSDTNRTTVTSTT